MDKNQKLIIKITLVFVIIIIVISLIIFLNSLSKKSGFIIPKIETNAIEGKPNNIKKKCIYQEAKVNDEYIVYLCAYPLLEERTLNIYFTSSEVNKGLIKVKVLDSENKVIGETGLINPDSYIKDISLNKDLKDKERITLRIMNYEKETYYSLGEIKLDLLVRKS